MKYSLRFLTLLILVGSFIVFSPVFAQSDDGATAIAEDGGSEEVVNDDDLAVDVDEDTGEVLDTSLEGIVVEEVNEAPSRPGLFFRHLGERLSLLTTFDPVKKAEKEQRFAVRAEKLAAYLYEKGNAERAEQILERSHTYLERIEEKKQAILEKNDVRSQRLLQNIANHQLQREKLFDRLQERVPQHKLEQFQKRRAEVLDKQARLINAIDNEQLPERVREHLQRVKVRVDARVEDVKEDRVRLRALIESGDRDAVRSFRMEQKEEREEKFQQQRQKVLEKKNVLIEKAVEGDESAKRALLLLNAKFDKQEKAKEQRQERREHVQERVQERKDAVQERREDVRERIQEKREDVREAVKDRREDVREAVKEKREDRREAAKDRVETIRGQVQSDRADQPRRAPAQPAPRQVRPDVAR